MKANISHTGWWNWLHQTLGLYLCTNMLKTAKANKGWLLKVFPEYQMIYQQTKTIARKFAIPAKLKHFHAIFIIFERNTTRGLLSVPDTAIQEPEK